MKHQHCSLDAEGEAQEAGAGEATQGRSGQSVVQSLYLQGVTEWGHMGSFTVLSESWRREVRKQPQEGFGKARVGTEGMVQFTNIQSYIIDFSPSRQQPKCLSLRLTVEWVTRGSFIQQ